LSAVKPEELKWLNPAEIVWEEWAKRKHVNESFLDQLKLDVEERGVVEPIVVRVKEGKYYGVCGWQRCQAALKARLERVPCIVKEVGEGEALLINLAENAYKDDIHPLDLAERVAHAVNNAGLTVLDVGKALRVGPGKVHHLLDLLKLPKEVLDVVAEAPSGWTKYLELLPIKDRVEECVKLARTIHSENLSREDVRHTVQKILEGKPVEEVEAEVEAGVKAEAGFQAEAVKTVEAGLQPVKPMEEVKAAEAVPAEAESVEAGLQPVKPVEAEAIEGVKPPVSGEAERAEAEVHAAEEAVRAKLEAVERELEKVKGEAEAYRKVAEDAKIEVEKLKHELEKVKEAGAATFPLEVDAVKGLMARIREAVRTRRIRGDEVTSIFMALVEGITPFIDRLGPLAHIAVGEERMESLKQHLLGEVAFYGREACGICDFEFGKEEIPTDYAIVHASCLSRIKPRRAFP